MKSRVNDFKFDILAIGAYAIIQIILLNDVISIKSNDEIFWTLIYFVYLGYSIWRTDDTEKLKLYIFLEIILILIVGYFS